jgi:hypothetical protein
MGDVKSADTLLEDARVVMTIGDEVMVVGTDAGEPADSHDLAPRP